MIQKTLGTLTVFIITCCAALGQGQVIDKVVAQVGDHIILLSDIENQKIQMKLSGSEVPANADCVLLEELMYRRLLVNQAEVDSVEVSDEQVEAEIESRFRMIEAQMANARDDKGRPMTIEGFYGKTKTQIREDMREPIRRNLKEQEVERKITADVSVSPREVEQFFNRQPIDSLPFINTQMAFQQIAIFPEITKADKELAYRKLQDIRKEIVEGGKDFERMARLYSMDPGSAPTGGKIEATRGMMVKPFEATAYSLKEGEVSEVFETEYGYHIMKLLSRRGDDYIALHILIIPEFSRENLAKASARMDECYSKLKNNEISWDDAVRLYSNDPNTKENHGIITNPITGEQKWDIEDINQVDPQMFQLTDGLQKGQFTAPSFYGDFNERKEGIRIVRLLERTTPHRTNLKDDYVLIRNAAENEKKQKAIYEWTASHIKGAYIRIDESYSGCNFVNNWTPKTN